MLKFRSVFMQNWAIKHQHELKELVGKHKTTSPGPAMVTKDHFTATIWTPIGVAGGFTTAMAAGSAVAGLGLLTGPAATVVSPVAGILTFAVVGTIAAPTGGILLNKIGHWWGEKRTNALKNAMEKKHIDEKELKKINLHILSDLDNLIWQVENIADCYALQETTPPFNEDILRETLSEEYSDAQVKLIWSFLQYYHNAKTANNESIKELNALLETNILLYIAEQVERQIKANKTQRSVRREMLPVLSGTDPEFKPSFFVRMTSAEQAAMLLNMPPERLNSRDLKEKITKATNRLTFTEKTNRMEENIQLLENSLDGYEKRRVKTAELDYVLNLKKSLKQQIFFEKTVLKIKRHLHKQEPSLTYTQLKDESEQVMEYLNSNKQLLKDPTIESEIIRRTDSPLLTSRSLTKGSSDIEGFMERTVKARDADIISDPERLFVQQEIIRARVYLTELQALKTKFIDDMSSMDLEMELADIQNQREQLNSDIAAINNRIRKLDKEKKTRFSELDTLEFDPSNPSEYKNAVNMATSEIAQLDDGIKQLKKVRKNVKEKITLLDFDYHHLQDRQDSMQKKSKKPHEKKLVSKISMFNLNIPHSHKESKRETKGKEKSYPPKTM